MESHRLSRRGRTHRLLRAKDAAEGPRSRTVSTFRDGQDRDEAAAESCADGMLALRRARTSEDYDQAAGALDLGP
jgi:hypothetical protein